MNSLGEIKLANKFKAVKRSQDRAKALNRGGSGRLVEIYPEPKPRKAGN